MQTQPYRFALAFFFLASLIGIIFPDTGSRAEEPAKADWQMVWSDEFNGTEIDPKKWDFDIGNGFYNYDAKQWISGWGNDELQYYTKEKDNAFVEGGYLHIRAIKESIHNCGYSSARLKSRKKDGSSLFSQTYGKFEFRAKLPTGQGVWPAIWMLPLADKYGTWASSGEIDILEARGQEPTKILGTLHFGAKWPANREASKAITLPKGGRISDFHTYTLEWEPGEIRWLLDGEVYSTQKSWWSSSKLEDGKGVKPTQESELNPWPAPFDKPFYLVMNLAIGGKFLGNPDKTTEFPCEMLIDYVRVYEKVGGYGATKPRGRENLPFEKK
ncbi:glycoside hydrolase family 16 protein [Telmatocola sphagniphila]|uniref:Glycoside hydrolase family 16 protein n=1 Tax=Telmatocola sphagniphila TaxID=1123043 RepID=A0A8E6B6C5_9BACT|nr:glycoside hydrolase family 16 protein [Telmatocola sphagniphila]QVL32910.1 glycoside hydrolase family 16 protein [Telmatocola sphagniphila]